MKEGGGTYEMSKLINGRLVEMPEEVRIDPQRLDQVSYILYEREGQKIEVNCVNKIEKTGKDCYSFLDQSNARHWVGFGNRLLDVRYGRWMGS